MAAISVQIQFHLHIVTFTHEGGKDLKYLENPEWDLNPCPLRWVTSALDIYATEPPCACSFNMNTGHKWESRQDPTHPSSHTHTVLSLVSLLIYCNTSPR